MPRHRHASASLDDTSISSLPTDLLVLILSRTSLRPRIAVLTLVCRRWREAVHRSLRSLPLDAPAALVRLPSVTSLRYPLRPGVTRNELPASLLSLQYDAASYGGYCACHILRPLTALTRLSLCPAQCCPETIELLRRSSNITRLALFFWDLAPECLAILRSVRLPLLTHLEVSGDDEETELAFVRAHSAQLTGGSFQLKWFAETSNLSLPACVAATVRTLSDEVPFARITAVAPRLTSLAIGLHQSGFVHSIPTDLPVALISDFTLSCATRSSAQANLLTQLVNLRTLSMPAFHLNDLPALTRLHTLRLSGAISNEQDLSLFMQCTQLTSLSIPSPLLQRVWSAWPFLRLESLTIDAPHLLLSNVCHYLTAIVKRATHLRRLDFCAAWSDAHKHLLLSFFALAERRHVAKVVFRKATRTVVAEDEADMVRRFKWLKVILRRLY